MVPSQNIPCYTIRDTPISFVFSTLQTVCLVTAFQCNLEQDINISYYVLEAELALNKTAIICQVAHGNKLIPQGDEH